MATGNVNQQIGLDGAAVVAAGATVCGSSIGGLWMHLKHVLNEATLLNKSLGAKVARMCKVSGMLLHVVKHSILALLRFIAVRAYKFSLLVLGVDVFCVCHPAGQLTPPTSPINFMNLPPPTKSRSEV